MSNENNSTRAEALATRLRRDVRPHRLAKDVMGRLWEFINFPYAEGDKVLVAVRVPGDPTSIKTVDALTMDSEHRDCYCSVAGEYYMKKEYYEQRAAEND